MKSVLISIGPNWCELIVSGKKRIDIRKSSPKEAPFKAYIYCTKTKRRCSLCDYEGAYENSKVDIVYAQQQIIGEFVCDIIYDIDYLPKGYEGNPAMFSEFICNNSCLSFEKIMKYKNGKSVYGWHISDLKIYDKPLKLSDFVKPCKYPFPCDECIYFEELEERCDNIITHAPRTWQYVEKR